MESKGTVSPNSEDPCCPFFGKKMNGAGYVIGETFDEKFYTSSKYQAAQMTLTSCLATYVEGAPIFQLAPDSCNESSSNEASGEEETESNGDNEDGEGKESTEENQPYSKFEHINNSYEVEILALFDEDLHKTAECVKSQNEKSLKDFAQHFAAACLVGQKCEKVSATCTVMGRNHVLEWDTKQHVVKKTCNSGKVPLCSNLQQNHCVPDYDYDLKKLAATIKNCVKGTTP